MKLGLPAAICLIGLLSTQPTHAGNLDPCDLARISVRNTIMDTYSQVISELARMTSANTAATERAHETYTDNTGSERFVDMTALVSALNNQEAADLGQADRTIAGECRGNPDELGGAARAAVALARRDISSVLSKHMTGVDVSRLLPRS